MINSGVLLTISIFLGLFQNISAERVFAVDNERNSSFSPYNKYKYVDELVNEDRFFVSESVIAISDGVGGWEFPSSHMAEIIVKTLSSSILKHLSAENRDQKKKASELISKPLIRSIDKYNEVVDQAFKIYINHYDQNMHGENIKNILNSENFFRTKMFGGAGTLLLAYIDNNSDNKSNLKVLKCGDSLLTHFREHTENGLKYFLPAYITDDMQKSFNAPAQISSTFEWDLYNVSEQYRWSKDRSKLHDYVYNQMIKAQIQEYEVEISDTDIIMLATDGLYDNLSMPLITIFTNYVLKMLEELENDGNGEELDPETVLISLIDQLFELSHKKLNKVVVSMVNLQGHRSEFLQLRKNIMANFYDFEQSANKDITKYQLSDRGSLKGSEKVKELILKDDILNVINIDIEKLTELSKEADDLMGISAVSFNLTQNPRKIDMISLSSKFMDRKVDLYNLSDKMREQYEMKLYSDETKNGISEEYSFSSDSEESNKIPTYEIQIDNEEISERNSSVQDLNRLLFRESSIGEEDPDNSDFTFNGAQTNRRNVNDYLTRNKKSPEDLLASVNSHKTAIPQTNTLKKDSSKIPTFSDFPNDYLGEEPSFYKLSLPAPYYKRSMAQIEPKENGRKDDANLNNLNDNTAVLFEPNDLKSSLNRSRFSIDSALSDYFDQVNQQNPLDKTQLLEDESIDQVNQQNPLDETQLLGDDSIDQSLRNSILSLSDNSDTHVKDAYNNDKGAIQHMRPSTEFKKMDSLGTRGSTNDFSSDYYQKKLYSNKLINAGFGRSNTWSAPQGFRGSYNMSDTKQKIFSMDAKGNSMSTIKQSPKLPKKLLVDQMIEEEPDNSRENSPNKFVYKNFKTSNHIFVRRILSEFEFSIKECNILELMDSPKSSETKGINYMQMSPCVLNLVKKLGVKKNLLKDSKYHLLSKSLVTAAVYFYKKMKDGISPFGLRGTLYGEEYYVPKPDDITVVVAMMNDMDKNDVKTKRKNNIEEIKDSMAAVYEKVQNDVISFTINKMNLFGEKVRHYSQEDEDDQSYGQEDDEYEEYISGSPAR